MGLVGDEEAGHGAVVLLHLAQVAGHLGDILLAAHHPVADEGVAGHHRGDQHRRDQVLLDLRVDVVRGQRQFGVDDVVADRVERGVVADQRGGEEATAEQYQQQQDQGTLTDGRGDGRHARFCSRNDGAMLACNRHGVTGWQR
ncbi:hypothetical protein D3C86_1555100 [compost metagenome]